MSEKSPSRFELSRAWRCLRVGLDFNDLKKARESGIDVLKSRLEILSLRIVRSFSACVHVTPGGVHNEIGDFQAVQRESPTRAIDGEARSAGDTPT
jgi:hypothetical protein